MQLMIMMELLPQLHIIFQFQVMGISQVDFCLKANAPLTNNATEEIPLVGETYSNSSSSNSIFPSASILTKSRTSSSRSCL